MPITILSPYSGQPVKVRDQDLGRALRDEEGRIFYLVQRTDGDGYYASLTRKGSEKDEQRYSALQAKTIRTDEHKREVTPPKTHDATGKRKASPVRLVLVLLVLTAAAVSALEAVMPALLPIDLPWSSILSSEPEPEPVPASDPDAQADDTNGPTSWGDSTSWVIQRTQVAVPPADPGFGVMHSGLRLRDLRVGDGVTPRAGQYVELRYVARTESGRELGRSREGEAMGFVFWSGHGPLAWDQGLGGLRVGGVRELWVPESLMERRDEPGQAPWPRGPVVFELELLAVRPGVATQTVRPGLGASAQPGDRVTLEWAGFVADASVPLHTTRDTGQPATVTLAQTPLIPGLELGILGMRQGETRRIRIPSYLAYGRAGWPPAIPPNTDLVYVVKLLTIQPDQAASSAQASTPARG